jgi:hypothetical protein
MIPVPVLNRASELFNRRDREHSGKERKEKPDQSYRPVPAGTVQLSS